MLVLWRVFEYCNLGCSFCGYSNRINRPRTVADPKRVLAFGKVLGEFAGSRGESVTVSWLGGEPLLWPELPRLSHIFNREYGIRVSVTTNGVPLESHSVRSSLVDDYSRITISVDGLAEFHDAVRDSAGLFDRVRRSVIALRAEADAANRQLPIHVNTILMRGNIANFEQLCRELQTWGVNELTFNQLGGNDRPEFYPDNRLTPDQIDRFTDELPAIRDEMAMQGLTIRGNDRYLQRLASTTRGLRIPVDDCAPGSSFLFIDERGLISPCSFTSSDYGIPIDETTSVSDLARLPETFARLRIENRAVSCEDCHSTQVFDKFVRHTLPTIMATGPVH